MTLEDDRCSRQGSDDKGADDFVMEIDLGKEWEGYVGDCQNSFEKDDYFTTQVLVRAGSSGTVVELLEQA